jgi:hypothetical protein
MCSRYNAILTDWQAESTKLAKNQFKIPKASLIYYFRIMLASGQHSVDISMPIAYYQSMLPHDTQPESAARQFDALKKMDINARAEMTFQLSDNLRSIVEAGIRQRHPDYSPEQITQAVLSLVMDKDIVRQAFGGREVSA